MSEKRTVLLTSYMRPQLTIEAINRVVGWKNLKKLIVVVDGLRKSANVEEEVWRKETLTAIESLKTTEKLELWVYSNNVGMTNHYIRLQERVLGIDSSTIWIEEDMYIDLDSYQSLEFDWKLESRPQLISGYSHFNHAPREKCGIKGNLFLPIWGLTMNTNFHELIKKIWHDKNYEPEVVKEMICSVIKANSLNEKIYLRRILRYWEKYMSWGFQSNKRWDALANYALWTTGNVCLSPTKRLVHDISFLDSRGMNQRSEPSKVSEHEYMDVEALNVSFCQDCEKFGSRVSKSIISSARYSGYYRFSKLLHSAK